jgi:putative ABC transport system permease protein
VLIGYPAAQKYLGFDGHPSEIYLRAQTDQVNAVHDVLAPSANPEQPNQVDVAQPSDALVAQADAKGALNSLFLGLGAVSLLVGAIGVGNVMLISVLERRSEIGLAGRWAPLKATSAFNSSPRPCSSRCWVAP